MSHYTPSKPGVGLCERRSHVEALPDGTGKKRPQVVIRCTTEGCDRVDVLRGLARLPEMVVNRRLTLAGWDMGRRAGRERCPDCVRLRRFKRKD